MSGQPQRVLSLLSNSLTPQFQQTSMKRGRSVLGVSSSNEEQENTDEPRPKVGFAHRSQSEPVAVGTICVKTAVERINSDPNLLGDGSKGHLLPVMTQGKHMDLKEINAEALVELINGAYSDNVQSFEIVDCRYPYEFIGGHIKGAVNLHTKSQIYERFFATKGQCTSMADGKRHIVIFHCEFSSQRGPEMCRYVRDCDRRLNDYPYLHYPELYVLFGGYKAFFQKFKSMCDPAEYLTMVDENFVDQCRFYKNLSKTDGAAKKSKSQGKQMRSGSMKKLRLDNM